MRAWVGLALYSIAYAAVPSDLGADVFVETAESPAQNSNQKAIDSLQSLAPDFLQNFKSIETQTLKTKEEQNAIEDVVDRLDGADYARDRFAKDFAEFMKQLQETLVDPTPELQTDIALLKNDLKMLDNNLNGIINKAREAAHTLTAKEGRLKDLQGKLLDEEIIQSIMKGQTRVDYRTGTFKNTEIEVAFKKALEKDIEDRRKSGGEGDPSNDMLDINIEMDEKLLSRLQELQKESDPAMLHLDVQFLQDFVILVLAGSACGILVTVFGRATSSIGFIFGGMVVGPSGLNLIQDVVAVQTLSQVGAVFLLFSHGVDYARKHASSWNSVLSQAMAPTMMLCLLCTALLGVLSVFGGATSTITQSVAFGLGATFSSTAILNEGLRAIRSSQLPFQFTVLHYVMACQDLLMVPTLAMPSIFFNSWGPGLMEKVQNLLMALLSIGSAGIVIFTISQQILPIVVAKLEPSRPHPEPHEAEAGDAEDLEDAAAAAASTGKPTEPYGGTELALAEDPEGRAAGGQAEHGVGDIFSHRQLITISIAAYALLVSLMSERIGLSPEAGALLAGLAISDRKTIRAASIATDPLTSLFGGIYLSSLGMLVSPRFIYVYLSELITMTVIIFITKLVLTFLLLRRLKVEHSVSFPASILFAQVP